MSFLNRRQFIAGAASAALTRRAIARESRKSNLRRDSVFELRQYTLYGGKRDALIELFEAHFIEPQEQLGLHVVATFRDLDDPDRFVWIRGFHDMSARGAGLQAFYGGPVWQQYRDAANATMRDSDNVLLLCPADADGFHTSLFGTAADAMYGVFIYYLGDADRQAFSDFFLATIAPWLKSQNISPLATLTTESAANNFPRLPVRERDPVFLWIARWPNAEAHRQFLDGFSRWSGWRDHAPATVLPALMRKPEILRLKATRRSPLQ